MDGLEQQLRELTILNSRPLPPRMSADEYVRHGNVAELIENLQHRSSPSAVQNTYASGTRKTAPCIPPKPQKKQNDLPQVPLSKRVTCSREPLYSQPLHGLDKVTTMSGSTAEDSDCGPILMRKQPIYAIQNSEKPNSSKSTLDNPAVLEQQLEALAYHKLQMEKRGLLGPGNMKSVASIPKLSSNSLSNSSSDIIYSNLRPSTENCTSRSGDFKGLYGNMSSLAESADPNVHLADSNTNTIRRGAGSESGSRMLSICTNSMSDKEIEEELPAPPSPVSAVSSSYSELRRATDVFSNSKSIDLMENTTNLLASGVQQLPPEYTSKNYPEQHYAAYNSLNKNHSNKANGDYYGYGVLSQSSSTYDSIYEPINPRPPGEINPRSCYNMYVNDPNILGNNLDNNASGVGVASMPMYVSGDEHAIAEANEKHIGYPQKGNNIDGNVSQYVLSPSSVDTVNEFENYGRCVKCNERVLGENSGCTAMDQIYHISCFTCNDCQINLQGKPFYALEGKPYCEYDYLQTLEKCSVCMKPILERILRATGKPYHPQCFTCVVCGKSLDGLLFTVDATNQNYCITDFHKKFAPRCCVCRDPIMPEPGQEETVRVVALDRSFHLGCYKCEDCGLLLSSEADGRGCYPLDDHVLCKSCNAQRVQALTNRMTSEN
ncbi:zyxin [Drosophila tropicalis]|uniref:zyxin n=1 Tax=Drosophila tropicalis TaxID=46794 RepID=UPI0035ABF92E